MTFANLSACYFSLLHEVQYCSNQLLYVIFTVRHARNLRKYLRFNLRDSFITCTQWLTCRRKNISKPLKTCITFYGVSTDVYTGTKPNPFNTKPICILFISN
jgi:hypothetical protein